MGEFRIETQRLILREWRDEDLAPLHAMCNDLRVMEFLGPLSTMAEIDDAIVRQRGFQAALGYCYWAVERRVDRAMIGFCGIMPGPEGIPNEGKPDIGWRLATQAWGQAFAREAAAASLDWFWANQPDDAVWAITVPANVRSWGLMERLGMARQPDLDFDHPRVPDGSPLKRHISYRINRPASVQS